MNIQIISNDVDFDNIRPIARCQNTGQLCYLDELVMQMEYRGTGLVPTGKWVSRENYDEPNPAGLLPRMKIDPETVLNPSPWKWVRLPDAPKNLVEGAVTATTIVVTFEIIPEAEYYVGYWTANKETKSSFDVIKSWDDLVPGNNPIMTFDNLIPDTTYIIQVASVNNITKPLYFKGNYDPNPSFATQWAYNISAPTDIQYSLVVKTKKAP